MSHRVTAEAGWAWTLEQVERDEAGPLIPDSVPQDGPLSGPRSGIHRGLGGLGLALAEVGRARPWTEAEGSLAEEVLAAVRADVEVSTDASWFDGLPGHVTVLTELGVDDDAVARAVARLLELATPTGWPTAIFGPPRYTDDARITDATLGTAGVLHAAVVALASGTPGAAALADHAAEVLVAEAEHDEHGPLWHMVPLRFDTTAAPPREMPNWSHGAAGVAHALAEAGAARQRPDWVEVARRAAERLVAVADTSHGLHVPHVLPLPPDPGFPAYSLGWCHGPSGTAQLFTALEDAGVTDVAGEPPATWRERSWDVVRSSGLPARGEPGFWDNDGRCCGTAGVGDLALTAGEVDLARACGDALVERAIRDGDRACWRFVEHRADDPLLPPGVGWMQGAAGISAFLFRLDRELG